MDGTVHRLSLLERAALLYLAIGAGGIHTDPAYVSQAPLPRFVSHYILFVLIEVGILWLLLAVVRRDGVLLVAGIPLCVMPLFRFGPSNDLVMRASIPALTVVALASASVLARPVYAMRKRVFWPIVCVLVLGVPTATTEIARAILNPVWKADADRNLIAALGDANRAHYVAELEEGTMPHLLKPVKNLPGFGEDSPIPGDAR